MMQFSVRTETGEHDSVTSEQLRQWAEQGQITPNDLVRLEGKQRWFKADAVDGLFINEKIKLDEYTSAHSLLDPNTVPSSKPEPNIATSSKPEQKKKPRILLWLLLLFLPFVISSVIPSVPLIIGTILLGLALFYRVRPLQKHIGTLYRISHDHPVRAKIKLTVLGFFGVFLIAASLGATETKAQARVAEAMQLAAIAEQHQLASKANLLVVALASKAEAAWEAGNVALAEETIIETIKTPYATNLAPIQQIQTRIANANAEAMIAEAIEALQGGDIDTATGLANASLDIPHVVNSAEAIKLNTQIAYATDTDRISAALMIMPDEAFQQLLKNRKLPEQLISGYEILDKRAAEIVNMHIAEITTAREKQKQLQLERELAAKHAQEKQLARNRAIAQQRLAARREEKIKNSFSSWNGSHIELSRFIKKTMNDPGSYKHVTTNYSDKGDHLIVKTTFRGKNGFGGVVTNWIKAKVSLDGHVLSIVESWP